MYHKTLYSTLYQAPIAHGISVIMASLISLLIGNIFLAYARKNYTPKAREYTPDTHKTKDFTPTMGGIFVIVTILIYSTLGGLLQHTGVLIALLALVLFGAIGLIDDLSKIKKNGGIFAKHKFLLQTLSASSIALLLIVTYGSTIYIPLFHTHLTIHPILYFFWSLLVIIGTNNAVNLTDGLDALVTQSLLPLCALYALLCYHTDPTGGLSILLCATIGALLGFLWYNAHPAKIFLGDVGSLALGALIATVALSTKTELILPVAGIIPVVETLSVILQVLFFKRYKKRIFLMAPLHHHFELQGIRETTIATRALIISILGSIVAFIMYVW